MKTISISRPYRVRPFVLDRETAPAYWMAGSLWYITATGSQTDNLFTMLEQQMPQGPGPASHAHPVDEGFYIIEGQITFSAGGDTVTLGPGGFLHIPRFCEHTFHIDTKASTVLNYYMPPGSENIVMSLAVPAASRTMPSFDAVPLPPPEQVEILAKLYGQITVGGTPFIDKPEPANMKTKPVPWTPVPLLYGQTSDKPGRTLFGQQWKVLANSKGSGGTYALCDVETEAGFKQETQSHGHDEGIYLLNGSAELVLNGVVHLLKEGAFAYVPAGTLHSFHAFGKTRRLQFIFPGGFERVIEEFGDMDSSSDKKDKEVGLKKILYEEGSSFFQ